MTKAARPAPGLTHAADELRQLWLCGLQTWTYYAMALSRVRRVDDVVAANASLALNVLELSGRAAGAMQHLHGAAVPTLNDA